MCIAIYNPKGVTLSKDTLARCHLNNPDGIGLAYHHDGEVFIEKYPDADFSHFYERYHELKKKYSKSNFLLHFRVCNAGNIDEENTHPHFIRDDLVFCHNGTFNEYNNIKSEQSDTIHFNENFLKELPPDFERYPKIMKMLDRQVSTNKLILLNGYGECYIVNEDNSQANWDLGCWFSNDSYKNYNKVKSRERETVAPQGPPAFNTHHGGGGSYQTSSKKKEEEHHVETFQEEQIKDLIVAGEIS